MSDKYGEKMKQIIGFAPGLMNCLCMAGAFLIAKRIGFSQDEALLVMSFVFVALMIHALTYAVVERAMEWAEPSPLVRE